MNYFLQRIYENQIRKHDTPDGKKIREYISKHYGVEIGRYTYGYEITFIATGTKIGSFCSIASGVKMGLMNHPMEFVSTNPFLYNKSRGFVKENRDVGIEMGCVVGDDVWIGTNAVILPDVEIGMGG